MLITKKIEIPPGTLETNPLIVNVRITTKRLNWAGVLFPDGCYGVVGVRFFDGGSQFAPWGTDYLRGNNTQITWVENRRLSDLLMITLNLINEASDYSHSPIIYLGLN